MINVNATEQQLLKSFRKLICTCGAFPQNTVMISAWTDDESHIQRSDKYCLVALGEDAAYQPATAGGARDALLIDGQLVVTIFSRIALDTEPEIDRLVLDNSAGLMTLMQSVRNVLHMANPQDPPGRLLLVKPLRYRGRTRIERLKADPEWGKITTYWLFTYSVGLTKSV